MSGYREPIKLLLIGDGSATYNFYKGTWHGNGTVSDGSITKSDFGFDFGTDKIFCQAVMVGDGCRPSEGSYVPRCVDGNVKSELRNAHIILLFFDVKKSFEDQLIQLKPILDFLAWDEKKAPFFLIPFSTDSVPIEGSEIILKLNKFVKELPQNLQDTLIPGGLFLGAKINPADKQSIEDSMVKIHNKRKPAQEQFAEAKIENPVQPVSLVTQTPTRSIEPSKPTQEDLPISDKPNRLQETDPPKSARKTAWVQHAPASKDKRTPGPKTQISKWKIFGLFLLASLATGGTTWGLNLGWFIAGVSSGSILAFGLAVILVMSYVASRKPSGQFFPHARRNAVLPIGHQDEAEQSRAGHQMSLSENDLTQTHEAKTISEKTEVSVSAAETSLSTPSSSFARAGSSLSTHSAKDSTIKLSEFTKDQVLKCKDLCIDVTAIARSTFMNLYDLINGLEQSTYDQLKEYIATDGKVAEPQLETLVDVLSKGRVNDKSAYNKAAFALPWRSTDANAIEQLTILPSLVDPLFASETTQLPLLKFAQERIEDAHLLGLRLNRLAVGNRSRFKQFMALHGVEDAFKLSGYFRNTENFDYHKTLIQFAQNYGISRLKAMSLRSLGAVSPNTYLIKLLKNQLEADMTAEKADTSEKSSDLSVSVMSIGSVSSPQVAPASGISHGLQEQVEGEIPTESQSLSS